MIQKMLFFVVLMALAQVQAVECDDNWTSSGGQGCDYYETHNFCTTDGNPGTGWDPAWGTFADYADSNGITALVCPQCGVCDSAEPEEDTCSTCCSHSDCPSNKYCAMGTFDGQFYNQCDWLADCGEWGDEIEVCPGSEETTCQYVAIDSSECIDEWNCYENWDEHQYLYNGNTYQYDYDCINMGQCPMDPNDAFEGMICEADAKIYMGPEKGGFQIDHAPDFNDRPAGTKHDEDNCGYKDVYKVECTSTIDIAKFDCSYVPNNDCDDDWNCYEENDEEEGFPYNDCGALTVCPMVIDDMSLDGMICEADANTDGVTPEGTSADLNNCGKFDVYEVVCVAKLSCDDGIKNQGEEDVDCGGPCDVCKVCSYVANDDCLIGDWGCDTSLTKDEYVYLFETNQGDDLYGYDYDCTGIQNCPATPTQQNEGMICEADALWALGQITMVEFPSGTVEADLDKTMPEGTDASLDNCYTLDVYEVVCVDPPTTTELETTEAAAELCATYTTAASCPASYCVIKNDRNGAFKKCKRIGCKTFTADEAACAFSAECEPKYKKDGSFKKCLLKKNLNLV